MSYQRLTRSELADEYVRQLRRVRSEGKRWGRRGDSLGWLRDPELRAVLAEFKRRMIERDAERAQWGWARSD